MSRSCRKAAARVVAQIWPLSGERRCEPVHTRQERLRGPGQLEPWSSPFGGPKSGGWYGNPIRRRFVPVERHRSGRLPSAADRGLPAWGSHRVLKEVGPPPPDVQIELEMLALDPLVLGDALSATHDRNHGAAGKRTAHNNGAAPSPAATIEADRSGAGDEDVQKSADDGQILHELDMLRRARGPIELPELMGNQRRDPRENRHH